MRATVPPTPPAGRRFPTLEAHHLRERQPPAMDPGLDGTDRHDEDLRDPSVRQVLNVGEHERHPELL